METGRGEEERGQDRGERRGQETSCRVHPTTKVNKTSTCLNEKQLVSTAVIFYITAYSKQRHTFPFEFVLIYLLLCFNLTANNSYLSARPEFQDLEMALFLKQYKFSASSSHTNNR